MAPRRKTPSPQQFYSDWRETTGLASPLPAASWQSPLRMIEQQFA
jgi:hypothetical protein